MKSSQRSMHPFGGCMTVSVVEDAHVKASTTSTVTSDTVFPGEDNNTALLSGQWEVAVQRKRASSFESWLSKTLHKDDPQALARRAVRRAKRKAFFRKLFGRSPVEDEELVDDLPRRSLAVDLSTKAPDDEASAYRLNEIYYASMADIMDQYRSDKDLVIVANDVDTTRVSILELDEEDQEDDDVDFTGLPEAEIVAIPVVEKGETSETEVIKEVEPVCFVEPPVRVPFEYTLADRRGGTLVAGLRVLYTSAAFKRKQRQFLYSMRAIPEDTPFVVLESFNSENEDDDDGNTVLLTDGILPIESNWV